jgi:integrase
MQRRTRHQLNFTKAGIEALAAGGDRREYHYDAKIPGLAVCVSPAGGKVFYVVRRVGTGVEFIRIGGWPETTVEQARTEATRINGKIADGINPADTKRKAREQATIGSYFAEFVERPTRTKAKRPKGERTKHEYRLLFNQHLTAWENRKLGSIDRPEIEALHNRIGESTPFAANRVLALLKGMFNSAIDDELINHNPAARIKPFEEASRSRRLHPDELPKFWKAVEDEPSEKVRDFVLLALFTGQRRSNVLAMLWRDVNLKRGVWVMPHTKTGRHEVPLSQPAIAILRRRAADKDTSGPVNPLDTTQRLPSDYVLPGRHGHGHLRDPMRAWKAICERAGIGDLRIHDLRRSLGSFQTDLGASRAVVGALLGHVREETTAIYGRIGMEPVRDSLNATTAAILAFAQPANARKGRG